MAPPKLPPELVEEILFRVPPRSLARFRTVCKRFNALFNDKRFINNHLYRVRPQFILRSDSNIYSVDINLFGYDHPSIEVRKLNLEYPGPKLHIHRNFFHCDGFLLCAAAPKDEIAVWNPWSKQTRWIIDVKRKLFKFYGLGYDASRSEIKYKILGFHYALGDPNSTIVHPRAAIYKFASNRWRDLKWDSLDWELRSLVTSVSLNGTLYWVASKVGTRDRFIQSFDFSKEELKPFCSVLPCKNEFGDTQVLAAFRGDRLSLLEQCHTTKKIEIWVTKNKINDEDVSWRMLMTVSIPNFPRLQNNIYSVSQPSYFIEDKALIVCTCDEIGQACIYIVRRDAFKKIPIDSLADPWPYHLAYVPSLVSIP